VAKFYHTEDRRVGGRGGGAIVAVTAASAVEDAPHNPPCGF
jgi:hypothetical protein